MRIFVYLFLRAYLDHCCRCLPVFKFRPISTVGRTVDLHTFTHAMPTLFIANAVRRIKKIQNRKRSFFFSLSVHSFRLNKICDSCADEYWCEFFTFRTREREEERDKNRIENFHSASRMNNDDWRRVALCVMCIHVT